MELFIDTGQVRFVERPGKGLIVEQGDQKYLARGWRLTPEFEATVRKILDHGLTCLIRRMQPSPKHLNTDKGVEYIGFSRTANERWVMVLDQYSGRPSIDRITVEKGYRDVLADAKVPFVWETSGGQNIFVESKYVRELLAALTSEAIEAVEHQRGLSPSVSWGRSGLIVSEAALQSALALSLRAGLFNEFFGSVIKVVEHPRWGRIENGALPYKLDIPDIILLTKETMFILELKVNQIGTQSIHQAIRYLDNPSALLLAEGRQLQGVVIGPRLSPNIENPIAFKNHACAPIRVLTYLRSEAGNLLLSEAAGAMSGDSLELSLLPQVQ
ncbi:hypothetical protein [Microvirga zambiensis]|uniref:hypothetical protein n=1 Tax=Microvirga zambiensis TaxID=1402137 RepID=UPI00191D2B5B|nr:hypothetical protein [Microvirga zambiensis]